MVSDEKISDEILEMYAIRYEKCRDSFEYREKIMNNAMIPWGMTATLLRELQRARRDAAARSDGEGDVK